MNRVYRKGTADSTTDTYKRGGQGAGGRGQGQGQGAGGRGGEGRSKTLSLLLLLLSLPLSPTVDFNDRRLLRRLFVMRCLFTCKQCLVDLEFF